MLMLFRLSSLTMLLLEAGLEVVVMVVLPAAARRRW